MPPVANAKDSSPKETKPKNLGIAQPVVWFNGNDTKRKQCAKPGIVVATDGQGALDIVLIPVLGGTLSHSIKGVHHYTDPFLEENPGSARNIGSWCSPEEYESMRLEEESRQSQLVKARIESNEKRLIAAAKQLKADGVELEEIARRLEISKEKVIEILA